MITTKDESPILLWKIVLVRLLELVRVRLVLALDAVSSFNSPIRLGGWDFLFYMKKYSPLLLALFVIIIATVSLCVLFEYPIVSMMGMNILMGSWFMVFGATKLINVSGFVASFRQYDIITKKIPLYGYLYPAIEFILGMAYIFDRTMTYWLPINIVTILISGLTTIGIVRSFSHPTKIHCACLGANTELTLGWITLLECGSMVIMALGMILWML